MARLSACLIVRDETDVIDACLTSLQGLADEIIVADTGSQDDTMERVGRYPASPYQFQWCNDFSAARNFAVDQATGDWILYIDADERVEVPNPSVLHAVLGDPETVAATVRLHPRAGFTAYAEIRLFRRDPRIRFKGVIHERVHDSVKALCRTEGRAVGSSDLILHHVGYDTDQSAKHPRNLPLLKSYLAKDPSRLYCWWHLGDTYRQMGNDEKAREAWEAGVKQLRRRAADPVLEESLVYASLVQLLHETGQPVEALLTEARAAFPTQLQIQWIEAKIALEAGDHEHARPVFERLAAINEDEFFDPLIAYDKKLFGRWAIEPLALCHFRAERYSEAARHYRTAAQLTPTEPSFPVKAMLAEQLALKASLSD